ncbi:multicopper oxidase domain-containing protein [Arthrobacter sp. CG_A4]|uniref:multicopper oxidase domain-containing protein n=1 Tax=Arthrobacter sp. CG_A4 TaxID=3071706 RepID=UPI002E114753
MQPGDALHRVAGDVLDQGVFAWGLSEVRAASRKETVILRPKQTVNPGQWFAYCHTAYHAERGMMGVFSYLK